MSSAISTLASNSHRGISFIGGEGCLGLIFAAGGSGRDSRG